MVRARYLYGTRIILDGALGLQLRQDQGGVPNTMAPVFNLVARYAASESTVFHVTAFRRESPSVSSGYDYLSTGAAVGFQQRLWDRYFARLDLTCYTIDYLASPALIATEKAHQTDTYFEVRPAYEVQFSHHRYRRSTRFARWMKGRVGPTIRSYSADLDVLARELSKWNSASQLSPVIPSSVGLSAPACTGK